MDELLKRRLIGTAVLVLGALLLASLLPEPGGEPEPEPGHQRVVIDLDAVTVTPPPSSAAAPDEPAPAPLDPVVEPPAEAAPEPDGPEPAEAPVERPEAASAPVAQPEETVETPPQEAAPPVPPPSAPPVAAAGAEKWFVQLGSFSDIGNARKLLERMTAEGQKGLISPTETAAGTLYRVRLGPYAGRESAEAARARAEAQGVRGSALVQE